MDIVNFPEKYQKKLDVFNQEIDELANRRRTWLDSLTQECCQFKIGDEVYNLTEMRLVGVVEKIERDPGYASDGDEDTRFNVILHVRYSNRPHDTQVIDSCAKTTIKYGTRDEYISELETQLQALKGK